MPGPKDSKLIKNLGKNIREARTKIGMSQEQLANQCDVELSSINRVELGTHSPSITLLYRIGKALKVDPRNLLP